MIAGALVVLALLAFGLHWFQPWKAFTSRTIIEAEPAGASITASGALVSHAHPAAGTAELVRLPDGRFQLVLIDLSTSDGPDVRVWLSELDISAGSREFDTVPFVELGPLKGTHGTQVYDLPPDTDVTRLKSVTLWCKRFSTSFAAAPLTHT
jgi:hypothetical protein